jgi:hypothetical protein
MRFTKMSCFLCDTGTVNLKMKLYLGQNCIVERNAIRVVSTWMLWISRNWYRCHEFNENASRMCFFVCGNGAGNWKMKLYLWKIVLWSGMELGMLRYYAMRFTIYLKFTSAKIKLYFFKVEFLMYLLVF